MALWKNPKVLEPGWIPGKTVAETPTIGWPNLLRDMQQMAGDRNAKIIAVTGPRGSGTSALASRLAREMICHPPLRNGQPRPRLLRLDLRACRGEHHAFVQLFRNFDKDFGGQGFSAEFLACLFKRRLAADITPSVIWIDNIPAHPEFEILWRTFLHEDGLSGCTAMILSGEMDPTRRLPLNTDRRVNRLVLQQLGPEKLLHALEGMAAEAFVTPPAGSVLISVRDRLLSRGWGLSMAACILKRSGERAQARGVEIVEERDLPSTRTGPRVKDPAVVDSMILEGARSSPDGRGLEFRALSLHLRRRLAAEGHGFPSTSQIRRHLIRLEAAGLLERRVRVGGPGGTRSLISTSPALETRISADTSPERPIIPASIGPRYGSAVSYPGRPSAGSLCRGQAEGSPRSFPLPSRRRG